MSSPPADAPPEEPTPEVVESDAAAIQRTRHAEEGALAFLAVLSLVGIAIADFSAHVSFWYWIAMAPIYAGVSLYTGWSRARAHGLSAPTILRQQALHWVILPVAIYLIYLLQATGRLNRPDAGLVALLALALTTFLAGVHFDWRLAIVGVALAAGAVVAALVEEFFWVFLIIAVPILGWLYWRRRKARKPAEAVASDPL